MPIYEFRCPKCNVVVSHLSPMDADGKRLTCKACGHEGLDKAFSVFASPKHGNASAPTTMPSSCHGCGDAASCLRRSK